MPRKIRTRTKNGVRHRADELLDEALEESFPASDPPEMTDPVNTRAPRRMGKRKTARARKSRS